MKVHSLVLSLIVIPAVALLGCSDSGQGAAEQKPTHKVSGTITMAGGPVVDAAVTFSPRSGQPPALGRTDSSGKYVLTTYGTPGDGAVEGDYAVLVSKSGGSGSSGPSADEIHKAVSSGGPPPASHGGGSGSSSGSGLLPEKYSNPDSTPFKATVLPDKENVFDFKIEP